MSIRIIYQTFVHILQLTFANKGSIISFAIKENRKIKKTYQSYKRYRRTSDMIGLSHTQIHSR